jgi:hypothetical protein
MKRNLAERLVITAFSSFIVLSLFSLIKTRVAYSATTHLVISEVQFAGDNGANDEFIEIYNPTNNPVDISTWSIQRKTATESPSFTKKNFTSPAIVPAHGYYLIAHTSYNGTVSADMTHGSFTLTSTGATIFLVNDQILLTAGNEESIVDKVAIGASALHAEGSPFPTIPESEQSIERVGDDTNNNSVDFILQTNPNPQNSGITPAPTSVPTASPTPTTSPYPASGIVVINEVAWAGTVASADDEWIELYNTSDTAINLTGWTLAATDGTPNIVIEGTIPAKAYFLLERSNDDTIKDISADQIYSGALGNTGESLELRNSVGELVDSANIDGGGWPAGNSTERKSMERINPLLSDNDDNWATNNGVIINGIDEADNPILGTPKNQNSSYQGDTPSPTPTGGITPTVKPTAAPSPTSTPTPKPSVTPQPTPTSTIQPTSTPTPSPTPTPIETIIATFNFPGKTITCSISFKVKIHKFFIMLIPRISCK